MANWNVLQSTFIEGEVSPRYLSQVREEVARNGVQRAENALVLQQGPITKRMGTEFAFDTGQIGYDKNVRLWPYLGEDNIEKLAVFYDGNVRVYNVIETNEGGATDFTLQTAIDSTFDFGTTYWEDLGSNTEVTGPNSSKWISRTTFYDTEYGYGNCLLNMWTDRGVDTVINGPGVFDGSPPYVRQKIQLASATVNNLRYWLNTEANAYFTTGNPVTGDYKIYIRIMLGTAVGLADLLDETHEAGGVLSGEVATAVPGDLWFQAEMYLEVLDSSVYASHGFRTIIRDMELWVTYVGAGTPLAITTPYTSDDVNDLHFVQSPFGEQELICLHPNFAPQRLYFTTDYTFDTYPFVGAPADWSVDSWPSIGCGHNGRLILSGVSRAPETIWGSAVFDWYDFDAASAVPDASKPYNFVTQVRGVNTWCEGFKNLSFGTTRIEFSASDTVGDSSQGVTIKVDAQSGFGSERMPQKTIMGKNIFLVTGQNSTIRLWRYSHDDGGYISPDVTLKAEHIGNRIFRRSFYTRDPHQILWNIMLDGSIALMGFDDQFNMISWSTFITDGQVLDGCTLTDTNGANIVFLLVRRIIENEAYHYVERITDLRNIDKWGYVDHKRTYLSDGTTGMQGSFFTLRGKTVAVFLDGHYDGLQVVTGSQVNVRAPCSLLEVGIPYNFEIETFPEASVAVQSGLTAKKRYSKVGVRGIYALPPLINGQRPPDRSPQGTMGIPEVPQDILDADVVDLNIDNQATVTIAEPLPYRCTITGIYGKLTSNQL